ncbi:glycosyltransferase family 39 protein [Synechococcus sp. LTW-R]|uniref:ArnT family glycosyltransferase n=1 Tax=Synechococcus sp. LTW-R TaxID=2751170 RepID=UPI00162632A0|nr:glycosyltransferase family 39 protein [Synechococcus sp. LTW-R]QNG30455.1 glycosyltransferase family 39 protein [Synechococcus sp. LTW-R]
MVWFVLGLGFCLRLLLAALLPPGYDEAYYVFYGRQLDLSYFDHPVAVGIWSWAGQQIGGNTLALRLPSLLSYTAALVLLADATKRWYGKSAHFWLVLLGSSCPLLFLCGGVFLLPDSPLLLGLALLLWWLSRHPQLTPTTAREALELGAIAAAITLSKYHAFIVLGSLLLASFSNPRSRQHWRQPWPYLSLLIWATLAAPLWLWNSQNDWISFAFQSGRTGASNSFVLGHSVLFLLTQLGLLFPTAGITLLSVLWPRHRGDWNDKPATPLLRMLAIPQLLVFAVLAGRMQVMASWLVPAWWVALPMASAWIASKGWASRRVRGGALFTGCTLPPLLLVAGLQMRWGILQSWLPTREDPSAQLMQPAEVRKALQSNPEIWSAVQAAEVIASHRYEIPGFLALALGEEGPGRFTTLSNDPRGFAYWPSLNPSSPSQGVLIAPVEVGSPLSKREFPAPIQAVKSLGSITVQRAGRDALELEVASFKAGPGVYPWPYRR